jgi:uncharacterized protein
MENKHLNPLNNKFPCLPVTLLISILTLGACGSSQPGSRQLKTQISLAAPPVVWGVYAETVGWVDVVNRHSNLAISVESKAGAIAVQQAVATGHTDLGYHQLYSETSLNYRGKHTYADKPWSPARNLRLIIGGISQLNATFMTSPRLGIQSMADLQNKRITRSAWNDIAAARNPILEAHGYDPQTDVQTILLNTAAEGWNELQLGRVDVVWDAINEGLLEVQENVGQIVFLPIEPTRLNQAKDLYPDIFRGVFSLTVKQGDVPGLHVPEPVPVLGFAMLVYANANLAEDAAYTIVTTLLDHVDEVRSIAGATRNFSHETALPSVDVVSEVPYHPGAIKAFKELGLWTAEHERNQLLIGDF